MKLKSVFAAAVLACLACGASAAVFDGAAFRPVGEGLIKLDGFGRTSETIKAPVLFANSGDWLSAAQAVTVPFIDTWNIDTSTVHPGLYSFSDLTVDATGSLLFTAVVFNSIDAQGERHSFLFDITNGGTQAVGSGTFSVLASCPIQSCVWIDVIGTQVAGSGLAGYGGTTIATPVPEPTTYGLMALGLLGLGVAVRRRAA